MASTDVMLTICCVVTFVLKLDTDVFTSVRLLPVIIEVNSVLLILLDFLFAVN